MVYWTVIIFIFIFIIVFKSKIRNTFVKIVKKILSNLKIYYYEKIKYLSELLRGFSNSLAVKLDGDSFIQNSLSPKLLADEEELNKIEPYIKRIDDGVRNSDVKNIALMGSYGSGKSTIIKNFEYQHPEYNVLNLSLGSYSKNEVNTKDNDKISEKEQEENLDDLNEKLENSLVKQMIYREKNSKLPYSRFKKIYRISRKRMIISFVIFCSLFISFLYLKNFLNLKDILSSNFIFIKDNQNSVELLFYSVFFTSSCLVLFQIFQLLMKQFKLSKFNFANISIEGTENNFSYFNKYIDEILYYFETNKFDVVVIEDVDRFKSIKVFEHLKELNILLNNSKQINRDITFVYAVKEDIFSKSEENIEEHESEIRTKFFELIIPIIPVVDIFNSRDYLVPMMKENSDKELTDEFITFLKDISLYIKDLRLLTNIVNEYFTYLDIHKKLSDSMSYESLFSMITLKNLVPSAYADLQKSQGFLYEIFVQREYDDDLIKDVNIKLEILESDIQKIDEAIKIDKVSATKMFFFENGISNEDKILLNGRAEDLSKLDIEVINFLLEDEEETVLFRKNRGGSLAILKSSLVERIKDQDRILEVRMNKKQSEIDIKKKELESFYRLSLQEKMKKYPKLTNSISAYKNNNYIDDNDFIFYLLSNGYVAENYSIYLSIFYEKNMTIDDKNLLVKLKSGRLIEFDEKIDNPKEFVRELLLQDFEKQGIININILTHIFSMNYEDSHEIRNIILEKFCEVDEHSYEKNLESILAKDKSEIVILIFELLRKEGTALVAKCSTGSKNKLINLIFYSCIGDVSFYYDEVERQNTFFDAFKMFYVETDDFENELDDGAQLIKDNILSRPNFFEEIEEYLESYKVMETLNLYNEKNIGDQIYFETINLEKFSQVQFDHFIRFELYEFEPSIFSDILNYNNQGSKIEVSYQNILHCNVKALIETTKRELNVFVEKVLLKLDYLSETEKSFSELLNSNEINSKNLKMNLIIDSNIAIHNIAKVKDTSLWPLLLEQKKCYLTWENLKKFYKVENINLRVLNSIFSNKEQIEFLQKKYDKSNLKESIQNFLKKLVDNEAIDINMKNINLFKVTTYDADNVSSQNIQILAKNNLINFNIKNVKKYKEEGVIIDIILNNGDEFLKNYLDFDLSKDDVITLIKKWNIKTVKQLVGIVADIESDDFFQREEFVDILLERKISSDEKLFEKLIKNIDISYLKKYFIFNLQESTLSNSLIENMLSLFYTNNITDFSFEEYDCIFENVSNNDLFVKLLNSIFNSKQIGISFIDRLTYWLKMQNKPISELYIDKYGKNKIVRIENSHENKKLIKNLKTIYIVSSFKEKDGDILEVNMKRKLPAI